MKGKVYVPFSSLLLLLAFYLVSFRATAQQRFPVTANTTLTPPYSVYFSDYLAPGSTLLRYNFVFNDFREASWRVRLRLRIESIDLKLETRPDFMPAEPIVVTPGVSVSLAAADMAQYLDLKNMAVLGSGAPLFLQNGRFPEGNYTFCIEVLDYPTGVLLSNTACASAWIRLNDPPRVISPMCRSLVDPFIPLNIPFQWQLINSMSPNATAGIEYKLVVYELTDPRADPFTAIMNSKVLPIFESQALTQTSFLYSPSAPALDRGKTYVYQIRARDIGGRDLFKNNGLSEVCWFHYGYPENANTTLTSPQNDKAYKKNELPSFRWSAPDLRLLNQPFVYELRVVQLNDGQDKDEAMNSNPTWHKETTQQTLSVQGMQVVIRKPLKPGAEYAWQVTTYSGRQTVAKSEVRKFKGPPLIDSFYAGKHLVNVVQADSKDSLNFSGVAKVRVGLSDSLEVPFRGLKLRRVASYWVLTEGALTRELTNPAPLMLQPKNTVNGTAKFYPRAVRLSAEQLELEGEVQWALPHPVKTGEVAYVKTERCWLNYDKFKLLGAAKLSNENRFDLLEPYDFSIQLNPKSDFLISNDIFELRFEGDLQLPEKVKGKQRGQIKVPFPRINQLFYFENLPVIMDNDVALVENTRIYLHPTTVTIDLSEQASPGTQQGNTFWKGLYLHAYELHYNSFTDRYSQLKFKSDIKHVFEGDVAAATDAWIDAQGTNLKLVKDFSSDGLEFNSFNGIAGRLTLTIEKNSVSNSTFTGGILVPVFSSTDHFDFTVPVTDQGFRPGYLNEIDGREFTFNKGGGEQEVNLTVRRGVFVDQRLIDMVIDLEWPSLGITTLGVTGFKAWGDYRIGFDKPNGVRALDRQLQGSLSGYEITADAIAAGSNSGLYSFVICAKALIGDDVTGDEGPPSINVYTIMPNELLPKTGEVSSGFQYPASTNPETVLQQIQSQYAGVGQNASDKLKEQEQSIKGKANETLSKLTSRVPTATSLEQATGNVTTASTAADPTASPKSGGLLAKLNPRQREIVREIIETVVSELTAPLTDSITAVADSLNARIEREIEAIIVIAHEQVEEKVASLVNAVAQEVINVTKDDRIDVSPQITALAEVVTQSVTNEVTASLEASINRNIGLPITTLIKDQIAGRINAFIREASVKIVIDALEGRTQLDQVPQTLLQGVDTVLRNVSNAIFEQINFSNISSMVYNTANDAVRGISTDRIFSEIQAGAMALLVSAANEQVNQLVSQATNDLIGDAVGIQIPVDFTTLVSKIADGDIKDIFKLDPVAVKLRTKVLDLNGLTYYTNDEPTYGDVWLGSIDIRVKVPKPFDLNAIYINGKKDGFTYWFAQITPSDGTSVKLGDVIPKKAKPLTSPINMGPADIVGVAGRVYHHMRDEKGKPIVPDANNKYGAYMNLVFFDKSNGGKTMRLDVAGEINTAVNGDYVITFEGDLQLMSTAPKVSEVDKNAAVQGIFRFSYNSAEKHFLGYGRVEIKKPGQLCASGSILVDTKPGKWKVEIGSREDRITFIPTCYGWSPTGWFGISESEAELGLGIQYSLYAKSPTFNFIIVKANVAVDAGVAFGIQAAVRYKPDFALLRAGVWADLWADIVINYKKFGPFSDWKSFSLVSIFARGNLMIIFEPAPSMLKGDVKGYVRLLSIVSINFAAEFEKPL